MELPLSDGNVTLVDDADFVFLSQWTWSAIKTPRGKLYVRRNRLVDGKYKNLLLHRVLMTAPDHLQVDHINGNSLDNRKGNLRLCTAGQNSANIRKLGANPYRGVHKQGQGWIAVSSCLGKKQRRGPFLTPEEAARAYDALVLAFYGNFAMLNFPAEAA